MRGRQAGYMRARVLNNRGAETGKTKAKERERGEGNGGTCNDIETLRKSIPSQGALGPLETVPGSFGGGNVHARLVCQTLDSALPAAFLLILLFRFPPSIPIRMPIRRPRRMMRKRFRQPRFLIERDRVVAKLLLLRRRGAVRRQGSCGRVAQLVRHFGEVVVEERAGEGTARDEVDQVVVREVLPDPTG